MIITITIVIITITTTITIIVPLSVCAVSQWFFILLVVIAIIAILLSYYHSRYSLYHSRRGALTRVVLCGVVVRVPARIRREQLPPLGHAMAWPR